MKSRRILIFLALAAMAPAVHACQSADVRYRVLNFFFDGVPPPGSLVPDDLAVPVEDMEGLEIAPRPRPSPREPVREKIRRFAGPARAEAVPVSVHKPYQDDQCTSCHDMERGLLVQSVESGLCWQCHQHVSSDARFVHGPVAVNACLECHNPHTSKFPKLLSDDSQVLCVRCHKPEELHKALGAGFADERRCVDCHDPHAGSDKYFLRTNNS